MSMRRRSNSCPDHRENVTLLANSALPEPDQAPVRDHLAHCAPCREYYEEIAKLSGEFREWAKSEPAVEAGAAFRARWMQSIKAADGPTPTSLPARISRWTEWLWPSPIAWGALAAVWVCLLFLQWATPAPRATGHDLARSPSDGTVITFAQRQRELSALLENLAPPPAPSKPGPPGPRSQRRAESVTT